MDSTGGYINSTMNDSSMSRNHSLLAACEQVAKAADIDFPLFTHKASYSTLEKIAEYAQFRFRLVRLSAKWWETDNGPLLAFKKEGHLPCALIPNRNGQYQLIDPKNPVPQLMTPELAETLSEEAYFFYRTLPNKSLRLFDIWLFVKPLIKKEIGKIILTASAVALISLITPIATSNLFSYVIPNSDISVLSQWIIVMLTTTIATLAFSTSQFLVLIRLRFRLNIALESATWDRLLHLPLSFFRQFSAGDLSQRSEGIDLMQQALTEVITSHLINSIFAFIPFILMLYYDWLLSLYMLMFMVLFTGLYILAYRLQLKYQRGLLKAQGLLTGQVLQLLTSISKLRATCKEEKAFKHCMQQLTDTVTNFYRSGMLSAKMNVFTGMMTIISTVIVFGIAFAQGDKLSFGHFIGFFAAFGLFSAALFSITQDILRVIATIPLYERIKSFYITSPEIMQGGIDPGQLTGKINVENVNFSYQPEISLLQDISLEINPGEFVAIVGVSGAGKTTLVRLLLGLMTPSSGRILYDGYDLVTLNLKLLRNQIGVVLQNDSLLAATVFENISGSQILTLEQAWHYARLAGFDKDIEAMPMGMQTFVMESGKTFSGGQRQRLMLARALARNPRILILDEAMNALDNATQIVVQKHLAELKLARIIVTHRLSSIRLADRIYVIDQGKVVQSGKYKFLSLEEGVFADLITRSQIKD